MDDSLENILIISYKTEMISFMDSHPEAFVQAIKLAISDRQPYAWRAAGLLWSCMGKNDPRIKKFIKEIINSIKHKNDGHQRELLKILLEMEVKEKYEGFLFDHCVTIWEDINKSPSVRVTALKIIIKIIRKHPDLYNEVIVLLRDEYFITLSPGVKKSVNKMIKEFTGDLEKKFNLD